MEGDAGVASSLFTGAAAISEEEAAALAAAHYGLRPTVVARLAGEKDEIFRLEAAAGSFVLKIAHPGDATTEIELTTAALLHLEDTDPGLPFERLVPALDGSFAVRFEGAAGEARLARLTTFLPGRILASVGSSPVLRMRLGETFARAGVALASFSHPAAERVVLWDIRQALRVRDLALEIEDRSRRDRLLTVFDRFEASVLPRLDPLRRQFLHNDFTGANVLIGPEGTEVVGLIDFGDSTVTQLVNDVAIAATEQLADGADPLGPALDLVAGYHRVAPLDAEELALLYDLVRTRTAALLAITEWRAERFPENRDYILRKTPRAWALLAAMEPRAAAAVGDRLIAACGLD